MVAGCPERLTWDFVRWIRTHPTRRRDEILRRLAEPRDDQHAVGLTSDAEVRRLLDGLPAENA